MRVFISYHSKQSQLVVAQRIKDFLDTINIDSFLAYDDLRASSDWKNTITDEIRKCEICVPLLSKEFKESDWCSQEIGAFYIQGKKFIPISLDGTLSYGFIKHIQSKPITFYLRTEHIVAEGLMESFSNCNGFVSLIKKVSDYRSAETIYKLLEPYYEKLNVEDLNTIIDCAIRNRQIYDAGDCYNRYLPKLLKSRKDDINSELLEKLKLLLHPQEAPK